MKILTIISDEHSYQAMRFSGSEYAITPNLDRLATRSVVFDNAYTPCPVCAPARAAWFSGQYVNRLGTWDNSTPFDGSVPCISSWLTAHGVPVCYFGKTHFHYQGSYGFSESDMLGFLQSPDLGCYYRDSGKGRIGAEKRFEKIGIKEEESFDDKVVKRVISWLEENKDRTDSWVLNVGLLKPHFPFYVKKENWDYFEKIVTSLPKGVLPPYTSLNEPLESLRKYFKADIATEEIIRKVFIGYFASIKELDDQIGLIIDKLEQCGLKDDVAVIYTSDHGEQLGYHGLWWKCTMFEQSVHIPLMISHKAFSHKVIHAPVSLVDFFPTLCDLTDVPIFDEMDGKSLLGLMKNGIDFGRSDFAFSEYHAHGMPDGMFMIRWKNYKYVFFTDHEPQLFDLEKDPYEDHDLVAEKGHIPEVDSIIAEGHARLLSVCDPINVSERAKDFQARMKKRLGLSDDYTLERSWGFVPRPEYCKKGVIWKNAD